MQAFSQEFLCAFLIFFDEMAFFGKDVTFSKPFVTCTKKNLGLFIKTKQKIP
jgi:hypothetical protein